MGTFLVEYKIVNFILYLTALQSILVSVQAFDRIELSYASAR